MIEVTYIDHMGSDLSVVNAARVSFGKESLWNWSKELDSSTGDGRTLRERDTKLIHYLAKHRHMSPFGHAFASFHVKAPIFVARQLVKHKFLRWNEISRRYVDSEPEFYEPDEWRGRADDKKQGSSDSAAVFMENGQVISSVATSHKLRSLTLYQNMIHAGVCPEQARMVLPQSTMTEWYWSGSLDAFMDMCNLRCKMDTQYETRLAAEYILSEIINLFPVSVGALRK